MTECEKTLAAIRANCLRTAQLDEAMRDFLLSQRPCVIYGAGNQGQLMLELCSIFRKTVAFFLVSPGHASSLSRATDTPTYSLDALPPAFDLAAYDVILALHKCHEEEIRSLLRQYEAATCLFSPVSWDRTNADIEQLKRDLFSRYMQFDLELRSKMPHPASRGSINQRLLVHIGMPKCGSTSLRHFLYTNRVNLQNRGIFYPAALNGRDAHDELFPNGPGMGLAEEGDGPLHIYARALQEQDAPVSVLSSNFIRRTNQATFAPFSNGVATSYCVWMRSPLPFAQSFILNEMRGYAEPASIGLRACNILSLHTVLRWQHERLLRFFNGHIPKEPILFLRSLDKDMQDGGIERCFLTIAGCDANGLRPVQPQNTTMPLSHLWFLSHVSMLPIDIHALIQIRHELIAMPRTRQEPRYRLFSRKQIKKIPLDIIHDYEALGKRMNDADFWQRGVDAMLKLEQVPWRQLPEDRQYEIFLMLSPTSQRAILDCWPLYRELPGRLQGSGFLPDIPEDEETAHRLRRLNIAARTHTCQTIA